MPVRYLWTARPWLATAAGALDRGSAEAVDPRATPGMGAGRLARGFREYHPTLRRDS